MRYRWTHWSGFLLQWAQVVKIRTDHTQLVRLYSLSLEKCPLKNIMNEGRLLVEIETVGKKIIKIKSDFDWNDATYLSRPKIRFIGGIWKKDNLNKFLEWVRQLPQNSNDYLPNLKRRMPKTSAHFLHDGQIQFSFVHFVQLIIFL